MTGQPKRRGRPPKEQFNPWAALQRIRDEPPTTRLRIKAGAIQQAFAHPTGTEWRSLPVVGPDAPDWEDSA